MRMEGYFQVTQEYGFVAEQKTAYSGRPPKLLDRLREALRSRHYSRRTEQTYCHWVKRFIFFHNVRHPKEMAEPEINTFLTNPAVKEKVSASTQNQALSALLFLYRHVIGREVGDLGEVIRARKPKRLPVVMNEILIRDGKGAKDRITMLPESLNIPLQEHLKRVKAIHERDLAGGWGGVQMPTALDRKYLNAPKDWRWQWVFPQENRWLNPKTKEQGRHHIDESLVQKAVRDAVAKTGLTKRATCHIGIPSPLTCSKAATIFERYKNSWAIATSRPR